MSFEPVLNELSLEQPAPDKAEACRRMSEFIATLTTATGIYKLKRTLRVKDEQLNDLKLAHDYPLAKWRNDKSVAREEQLFFRRLTLKHPILVEHADKEDVALVMDCRWRGKPDKPAIGLQAALLLNTLAISIPSSLDWNTAYVEVVVRELDTDGKWLPERTEHVCHAGARKHLKELASWITQRRKAEKDLELQSIQTSAELWEQRRTLYPSLEFCAVVQGQLEKHKTSKENLKTIRLRLLYLEQYSQVWSKGAFDNSHLSGNASPESEATLQHPKYGSLREFDCPDGQKRQFSWHLKMHDGWRIHFYPDAERQVIIVGYIGPHLPTVKFN